jgi:hypothetical protein
MDPELEKYLIEVEGVSERRIQFYKMFEEELEKLNKQDKKKHRGA